MCTFPDERIHFIQISIQLPMLSLLECENNRGGGMAFQSCFSPVILNILKKTEYWFRPVIKVTITIPHSTDKQLFCLIFPEIC